MGVYTAALPGSEEWKVSEMAVCFVILPFGKTTDTHDADYWKDHFENFIKPAIERALDGKNLLGYQAELANPPGGGIIENVFKNLQEADVVLADLTDFNPNVVYELALRQCLQDRTIMILEKGPDLPFYFKNYRIIRYSKDPYQNVRKFQEEIERILLDFSRNADSSSDNPISDYFRKTRQLVKVLSSQAPDYLPYEETASQQFTFQRRMINAIQVSGIASRRQKIPSVCSLRPATHTWHG